MVHRIYISTVAYFTWVMLLLLVPIQWCLGLVLAISVHELGHLLLLYVLKIPIHGVELHATGVRIHASQIGRGEELVCAAAGPLASFCAAFVWKRVFPEMALCAMVQGYFNLLPVYPMDGGRILRCLAPDAVCGAMEIIALILLWGWGIWSGLGRDICFFTMLPAIASTIRVIPGKFPCKE